MGQKEDIPFTVSSMYEAQRWFRRLEAMMKERDDYKSMLIRISLADDTDSVDGLVRAATVALNRWEAE